MPWEETGIYNICRDMIQILYRFYNIMNFQKFQTLENKYLNLGSLKNTHPVPNYQDYIGINPPGRFQNKIMDLDTGKLIDHPDNVKYIISMKNKTPGLDRLKPLPYTIYHDIEEPFPLPDNSVDRIHSEDCFEHIEVDKYPKILKELYRILKPGGVFRLAVPDYLNPKDRFCLELGYDPRNNLHISLTNYELLKPYLDASPFKANYLHYWKNETSFIQNKIDYSQGYIRRTPDNDERNKGDNKLLVTSFICDLIKAV